MLIANFIDVFKYFMGSNIPTHPMRYFFQNCFFFQVLIIYRLESKQEMHKDEPSLLDHFTEVRTKLLPEGGLTNVIYW